MSRNVVLVTVDSLRADHCGFMGYERETTPTLDRMADEGLVFENAVAPGPSTFESMPAIFTGDHMTRYHSDAEQRTEGPPSLDVRRDNLDLNLRQPTLPEWFERRGYSTAAFTPNPYTASDTAFSRGFDRYEDFMDGGEGRFMRAAAELPLLSEIKHVVTLVRRDRASKPWTDYYEDIVEWVQGTSEPYFLWIFLLDAHTPYLVDEEFRDETGQLDMYYHNWKLWKAKKLEAREREQAGSTDLDADALRDLYDGTIRFVDQFLERLWSDLQETDPAFVVHADHGEAFGEHEVFGHGPYLYEENIHVPLVAYNVDESGTVTDPTSLTVVPELLQRVATAGEPPRATTPALSKTLYEGRIALRGAAWKYIGTLSDAGDIVDEEFYLLERDPNEEDNRVEEFDDLLGPCRELIHRCRRHEREQTTVYNAIPELEQQL